MIFENNEIYKVYSKSINGVIENERVEKVAIKFKDEIVLDIYYDYSGLTYLVTKNYVVFEGNIINSYYTKILNRDVLLNNGSGLFTPADDSFIKFSHWENKYGEIVTNEDLDKNKVNILYAIYNINYDIYINGNLNTINQTITAFESNEEVILNEINKRYGQIPLYVNSECTIPFNIMMLVYK